MTTESDSSTPPLIPPLVVVSIETPLLPLKASFDDSGLARLEWADGTLDSAGITAGKSGSSAAKVHILDAPDASTVPKSWLDALAADLNAFFTVKLNHERLRTPLSKRVLDAATPFRRSVWNALKAIPPGRTQTYGQIARKVGNSNAARAVGGACRENPWLLLIPCHRAVGSEGLGGFAGKLQRLDIKRILLEMEGAM